MPQQAWSLFGNKVEVYERHQVVSFIKMLGKFGLAGFHPVPKFNGATSMGTIQTDEVFGVASSKELAETGGGHNQKGVDFQRAWAIGQMFEMAKNGHGDFLFLFESVQDVAILDDEENPTKISIFQVKKKDRNEWKWRELTGILEPPQKKKKVGTSKRKTPPKPISTAAPDLSGIKDSPFGKLYRTVISFNVLNSTGIFISNSGCDIPLSDGTNLATSLPRDLSKLDPDYYNLLIKGLELLHTTQPLPPKSDLIKVEKVPIHPDAPITYLVGKVHAYLLKNSPRHAGQASSLVDALMAKVSPLGAKTDSCTGFMELRKERGYSKHDFMRDVGDLEQLPDQAGILDFWLTQLLNEKTISFITCASVRTSSAQILRSQLLGSKDPAIEVVISDCDRWLETHQPGVSIGAFIEEAMKDLKPSYPNLREHELIAYLLLRAALKCVDLI